MTLRAFFAFAVIIIIFQFLFVFEFQEEFQIPMLLPMLDIVSGQQDNSVTGTKTVNYYARFNCGSINDDSGPLRPGKYDSDITIFNKKDFPVTVIWKSIAVNQQYKSNFNILNIPSEHIVNINCAKIFPFFQANMGNATNNNSTYISNNFVEGIVKIEISISGGLLVNNFLNNPNENIFVKEESDLSDLVNVDVLHTVNTLDDLNKEALYLKTDFSIGSKDKELNGTTNAIETTNLTAVFRINSNQIVEPYSLIKNKISENFTNNNRETVNESPTILLHDTEVLSNTFTDNHALTFQRIDPVIS